MILSALSAIQPVIFAVMPIVGIAWLVMAVVCIKGCNWTYVWGFTKRKDSEKFDLIAMNRYIGKMMLLPFAAWTLALWSIAHFFISLPGHTWLLDVPGVTWFFVIAAISTIILLGSCYYTTKQLRGARFMR